MNLLDKLCKELGVEIGEIWQGNDEFRYCILSNGDIERYEEETSNGCLVLNAIWKDILIGELKPVWKPKEGEKYYIPNILPYENERFEWNCWDNDDEFDKWFFDNNMVFKTKEEAIAAANKMIRAIKEDK